MSRNYYDLPNPETKEDRISGAVVGGSLWAIMGACAGGPVGAALLGKCVV